MERRDGRDTWLQKSILNLRANLSFRHTAADRLALVRSLTRLNGGRLDLSAEEIVLSPDEEKLLHRFGLRKLNADVLHIEYDTLREISSDLPAALDLDINPRTVFAPVAADAPLLRWTDYPHYRGTTQKTAVQALMTMPEGAAMMVSMPTGSGKSLLFQIAARFLRSTHPGACVLVFTPTVALAVDHERTLSKIPGLQGSRALTGGMPKQERAEILNAFRRGEVPILLLSPELAVDHALAVLTEASKPSEEKFDLAGRLMAVFVDEAHIIESWGRTFRPNFQRLPALVANLKAHNPALRTILLSATINGSARKVLRQAYGAGVWLEVTAGVPRYDFDLVVQSTTDETERDQVLLTLIDQLPRPLIVYTTRVANAADLFATLRDRQGYASVALFSGDIVDNSQRQSIVKDWAEDKLDLIVATSAFGLGVDKQNVRTVIHACLPESPSRYYQEVGRASRDGHQGLGMCYWTRSAVGGDRTSDEYIAQRIASGSWLTRDLAEKRWKALRGSATQFWSGANRCWKVSLDAAREDLGRFTGEKNRRWNMSLLNLLQRSGAIRIDHISEPEKGAPVWDFVVLDDGLLSAGDTWEQCWDRIFKIRNGETSAARAELSAFKALMSRPQDSCLLTTVFDLIDPDEGSPPTCGRCSYCRARGVAPPMAIKTTSQAFLWKESEVSSDLAPGILLLSPDDATLTFGLDGLIATLVASGIEQFVVPDRLAHLIGQSLAARGGKFGLVYPMSDWLEGTASSANLPTAILLDNEVKDIAGCVEKTRQLSNAYPDQTIVLVGDPERLVSGRPLAQIVSKVASYNEVTFVKIARPLTDTGFER